MDYSQSFSITQFFESRFEFDKVYGTTSKQLHDSFDCTEQWANRHLLFFTCQTNREYVKCNAGWGLYGNKLTEIKSYYFLTRFGNINSKILHAHCLPQIKTYYQQRTALLTVTCNTWYNKFQIIYYGWLVKESAKNQLKNLLKIHKMYRIDSCDFSCLWSLLKFWLHPVETKFGLKIIRGKPSVKFTPRCSFNTQISLNSHYSVLVFTMLSVWTNKRWIYKECNWINDGKVH